MVVEGKDFCAGLGVDGVEQPVSEVAK